MGKRGWLSRLGMAAAIVAAGAWAEAAVSISSVLRAQHESSDVTWVALTITNPMSVAAECVVNFKGYSYRGGTGGARIALQPIPPGATRTLNIPVPVVQPVSISVRERDGNETYANLPSSYGWRRSLGYLHVAEQSNHLNEAQLDDFTLRISPEISSRVTGSSSSSGSTTRTLTPDERIITQATVADLPENWVCYVPLYSMIMAESVERGLSAPQREALDTWLEAGGSLVLYGGDEETTQSRGAGSIWKTKGNPIVDASYLPGQRDKSLPVATALEQNATPFEERRAGGRNGAFALTTLFLIIAGPMNYFYFMRRGQIRKLIVTLPLISLAFCSLIAVYFVLTQGFQRKGGSMSLTLVDENTNHGMTLAKHSLLSGLYPMGGFKFSPRTYFQTSVSENQLNAQFDLTRETTLQDGLFQPGIPFNYSTMTPFTTRERMVYDAEKASIRNGFELPVKALAVLDGGRYYLAGATGAGGQVTLKPVDEADVPKPEYPVARHQDSLVSLVRLIGRQSLSTAELSNLETLTASAADGVETSGTIYAALLDGVPKSSDSGVKITDGKNLHVLLGIVSHEGVQE